ncbi:MAG: hypothetical protein ABIH38_00295 [Patescibacteria group bacterium]
MAARKKAIKMPEWKKRVVFTIVLAIIWIAVITIYNMAQGPIEGKLALGQINGGTAEYAASREVARGLLPKIIHLTGAVLLAFTWVPFVIELIHYKCSE